MSNKIDILHFPRLKTTVIYTNYAFLKNSLIFRRTIFHNLAAPWGGSGENYPIEPCAMFFRNGYNIQPECSSEYLFELIR